MPDVSLDELQQGSFPVHPDEPNLYQIPEELYPTYRPLPVLWQVTVWFLAAWTSVSLTYRNHNTFPFVIKSWVNPLVALAKNDSTIVRKMVSFLIKTLFMAFVGQTLLQDALVPPTRISTQQLIQKYVLPSTLSNYESVSLKLCSTVTNDNDKNQPCTTEQELGVHYLQYPPSYQKQKQTNLNQKRGNYQFQSLYLNHGFGASSLSWLPVLPKLVDRLRVRVGLGHDAVGFGFTQRPSVQSSLSSLSSSLEPFTPTGSAAIGTELLRRNLVDSSNNNNDTTTTTANNNNSKNEAILLMGHSMGSLATLQMALALPPETPKWIVLVAPALGMRPGGPPTRKRSRTGAAGRWSLRKVTNPLGTGASAIARYALKRLVG
jgi:pimeloyl-ACP methyl ester carboxylesterase